MSLKHMQRLILSLLASSPLFGAQANPQQEMIDAIQRGNLALRAPVCSKAKAAAAPSGGINMSVGRSTRLPIGTTAQIVNGCAPGAKIQFGAGPSRRNRRGGLACGQEKMSPGLARKVNAHLLGCTQEAAAAAGVARPERIHVHSMGCHSHRAMNLPGGRRGGWSQHAYGNAWDISGITLIDASGNERKMSMHQNHYCERGSTRRNCIRGSNARFYDTLRKCWARNMRCRPESVGHNRSMASTRMYGNSLHADHLHLEHRCR